MPSTLGISDSFLLPPLENKILAWSSATQRATETLSEKIEKVVKSPLGQGVIGFGLGVASPLIYGPLTAKIISTFGLSSSPSPFLGLDLPSQVLLAPFVCILAPIIEEKCFRGDLSTLLKDKLASFYQSLGFSDASAKTAAKVTALFFTSIIFGLAHFINALVFWCNPLLFLPQVIATTIMGLLFGLAKELTGELDMPIGMHIGNNTLAWSYMMYSSL